jgi:hypothetical protein
MSTQTLQLVPPKMDVRRESIREADVDDKAQCAIKGLVVASGLSYEIVDQAFLDCGRKRKQRTSINIIKKVLKKLNLSSIPVKRSGSLEGFIRKFPKGSYYCIKRGHAFAVVDGEVYNERKMGSHIKCAWRIE